MASDPLSTTSCQWCSKTILVKEAVTREVEGEATVTICPWCDNFDTKADMEAAQATIVADAINPELSEFYGYPWI